MTSNPHPHSHSHSHSHNHPDSTSASLSPEHQRIQIFLEAHFGPLGPSSKKEDEDEGIYDEDEDLMTLIVELDGAKARVDLISMVSILKLRE